jgi:hypothetical protein
MVTELINKKIGQFGRMISGSKSGYHKMYPNNLAIFNSNICTKSEGKVWFGDIDLTESKFELSLIAAEIGEPIYVLYEMDARFENEANPVLSRAAAVFLPDGSIDLQERLKEYYTL